MPATSLTPFPMDRFRKVYVEIGNVCNLQCSFCPEVERKNTRLSGDELRNILIQVKPFTESVTFHLMGEPLAHPEFAEFVGIAGEVGLPVEITTNATLLKGEKLEALLHPIVRQVNFSLQSYADNFPDKPLAPYLENIFAFCRRAFTERPDLYLNLRLWNLPQGTKEDLLNEEILRLTESEFGIEIKRRVDARLRKSKKLLNRLYLHYDTRFQWPNAKDPELRSRGTCQGTRSHLAIHADGTVVPCCLDKEANLPLGNIKEDSFAKIAMGPRAVAMRNGFESGRLVEEFCRKCTYSERFPTPAATR